MQGDPRSFGAIALFLPRCWYALRQSNADENLARRDQPFVNGQMAVLKQTTRNIFQHKSVDLLRFSITITTPQAITTSTSPVAKMFSAVEKHNAYSASRADKSQELGSLGLTHDAFQSVVSTLMRRSGCLLLTDPARPP